ncbi:MAG: hypothetical protein ACMG6H_17535 [Acidobacteriota bacterium]
MAHTDTVTLTGYLVDNNCGASHATDKAFATWVKTHSASCAKMDACEKSGYSVFADNKLYKFDEKGNTIAADLLSKTKTTKGLHVTVEGTVDGDTINVTKLTEVAAN